MSDLQEWKIYCKPPALHPITNNVIPKLPSQGKPDIIKHFINNPRNIGCPDDAQVYEMLRAEAIRHKHALLRAKEQIPSHLPKTWNYMDRMAKSTEISLFEYKVYRMFRLSMHLCKDHWVANFLLRKAATIREVRDAPSGTSSLVTRTMYKHRHNVRHEWRYRPSCWFTWTIFELPVNDISNINITQNTSGESSAAYALFSVFSQPQQPQQQQQQPQQQPQQPQQQQQQQQQPPTLRLQPHPTSP
ncbi:hypothetical protein INT45_006807 [Circinella minor]|uniref:Uncharacterized protein n=1 Tax=Circinella minor TaxID=1195481 RepID=A0A8H7V6X0_9FUNG|nr:hypothetical protein INT45_006807 [Circinella minor]